MLINSKDSSKCGEVKFISYTGKWPCLCVGTLTLEINGKEYTFGHGGKYYSFWHSGGSCGFTNGYRDSYVNHGEWKIDIEELPEELRCYASEIDEVLNATVAEGCCGGGL